MRNKFVQMSLLDTYNDVCSAMEENKSAFLTLLEEHINLEELIPQMFKCAFYRRFGRSRVYSLESFLRFFILQKILGISDNTLLNLLRMCRELREYCDFDKVPDASKITRFRQDFVDYIQMVFDNLVEITEPICRELDAKKADYLIYDSTGVVAYVAENNPKFLNAKLGNSRKSAKKTPQLNAHALAYASMPKTSATNPFVKQQYINGHFCYTHKVGILTNGLDIVSGLSFFDENFKHRHTRLSRIKLFSVIRLLILIIIIQCYAVTLGLKECAYRLITVVLLINIPILIQMIHQFARLIILLLRLWCLIELNHFTN